MELILLFCSTVSDRIRGAREARAACGDVSVAGAGLGGTDPKGIQRALLQMKPEPHRFAGQRGEVFSSLPRHGH